MGGELNSNGVYRGRVSQSGGSQGWAFAKNVFGLLRKGLNWLWRLICVDL